MQGARVIGCTTTGAAIVRDLLQSTIRPGELLCWGDCWAPHPVIVACYAGVVMIEEAGEVRT